MYYEGILVAPRGRRNVEVVNKLERPVMQGRKMKAK